jgi:hypothetical protein
MADDFDMDDELDEVEEETPKKKEKAPKESKAKAKKAKPPADNKPKKSLFKGIRDWVMDSYNGLFKIVIEPQLPKYRVLLWMILSFLFGMFWAYNIASVVFYNGTPNQLNEGARDNWIINVAGSYQSGVITADDAKVQLARVENPNASIDRLLANESVSAPIKTALSTVKPLAVEVGAGTSSPTPIGIIRDILGWIISGILFVALAWIVAIAWGLLIGGYVERFWERIRPKSEADIARNEEAKRNVEQIRERKRLEEEMRTSTVKDAGTVSYGAPLMQRIAPYTKGRQFDESFAIEDTDDNFLGECGATIAHTIGDSQELSAIEVWLFDKEDFVKTFTKIFASEHAYNDYAIRAELESRVDDPANDIVILKQGAVLELSSKMLRVQAKVAAVTMGTDGTLPPNSHFSALTLQMQGWEKKSGTGGADIPPAKVPTPVEEYAIGSTPPPKPPLSPTGARPLDAYQIDPPPPMPTPTKPPMSPTGARPLDAYEIGPPPPLPNTGVTRPSAPPPLPFDEEDEDNDPFGGTGDFTPING